MRIVMITDTYPPNVNGAALATERLAQELAVRGHEVSVIAPSTTFKHHTTKQKNLTIYRVRSIPILVEKTQEFRVSPKPFHDKEVRKIINEFKPDLIHVNEPWLMGLSAIKLGKQEGIPVIATHHFMPENLVHYLHLPPTIANLISVSIWKWYAKICQNFSIVICPTQTAADLIKKYSSSVKLKVISNGINLQTYNSKNNGDYLKEKYKLPKKLTLLFVGRLDKEKNIETLIRASALLKQKVDFNILIVGQGKERAELKKLATQLSIGSIITFTGFLHTKDLPNIYSTADIFVMPSIAELQSLVTMEAMASGLPIIAANAVALPHLVHTGENGFLFDPTDEKDLTDKLLELLTHKNLRVQMGKKSLAIIKEHDIQETVKQIEETYKNVVEEYSKTVH